MIDIIEEFKKVKEAATEIIWMLAIVAGTIILGISLSTGAAVDGYNIRHQYKEWNILREHRMEECNCYIPRIDIDSISRGIFPEWLKQEIQKDSVVMTK